MTYRATVIQPPLRVSRDFVDYPYHCDLGVVQAAAVLREAGFDVRVVDAFALDASRAQEAEPGMLDLGADVRAVAGATAEADVIVVHYTPFHRPPSRDPLLGELLTTLRTSRPLTPIALADLYQSGQHYVEADGQAVLAAYPEADALLRYQAEVVLVALCNQLAASGRPGERHVLRGPDVADLDRLPLPAWDLVDLAARDRFFARLGPALGRGAHSFPLDGRTLPIITSRGCPHRCVHCSSNPGRTPGARKTQRRLGPARLETLVAHTLRHGATRVVVLDEMVNLDPAHFDRLLGALGPSGVAYDFPNGMRADRVSRAQLEAMAGRVHLLSVSAESGVQRVVDEVIGKRLDLGAVERTVGSAAELGIPTLVHFIIGLPGETGEEINQTLEWALHLHERHGAWPAVQFATPLPGTRLAEAAPPLPGGIDFSPRFQHRPSTHGDGFDPEALQRFAWTFHERLRIGREPQKVILNLTYRCNNHCGFCAVGNRGQEDGRVEDQRRILSTYRERGSRQVDFDGGEPTIYPHLVGLIRYARRLGYESVHVTTNGRMCAYREFAARLVHSGLTSVLFSVHGADAETHGQNVGVAEAFEQTTAGIRHCVLEAPPGVELGMNITVTRSNVGQLDALAQLAWDLGLRWLNLQWLTPFGRATTRVDPGADAAAATMAVLDTWRDRLRLQVINAPFCLLPGYEELVAGDLLKVQRHMVFTNNEQVNLADYLRRHRAYEPQCAACPYKAFCGGFYRLEDSPEPPWDPGASV